MRRRVIVRGTVQGVGFRWFVRLHARALGLAGYVRNLPDGGVELEVDGEPAALEELIGYVGEGPDGAVVTRLEDIDPPRPDAVLPHPFAIER